MDWNQAYLDANTPWDKGMPSPVLVELLGEIPINAKMVVPGCGTGNDHEAFMAGLAFAHQNLSCLNGDLHRCCCHLLELALVALCEERNLSQMIEPCVGEIEAVFLFDLVARRGGIEPHAFVGEAR